MIAFKISEQMSCDSICEQIQGYINRYQKDNGAGSATGKIIRISIHDVVDSEPVNTVLAIEYKN
jgi:hypothetical protein